MAIMRYQIADYISETAKEEYKLMGTGFSKLDENPNAQTEETVYICDKTSSTDITSYKSQYPFTSHLIKDQDATLMLYNVGRNHLVGEDAEKYYVRVDLYDPIPEQQNTYKARKKRVSVEVSSCSGESSKKIEVSGNLNAKGDPIEGTFNISTKTFTPDEV